MVDYNNYFEVIMGLDVYVRRVNKEEVKAVEVYVKTNWPKVQSGEMCQSDYWDNYPYLKQIDELAGEMGIRKFWSLFDYLKDLTGKDDDVFILDVDQVKQCREDALTCVIGDCDDFCYERKCTEFAAACDRFLKNRKESDVMQVVFDY